MIDYHFNLLLQRSVIKVPTKHPCSKSVKVSRMKYIENIKYCLLVLFTKYGNIVDINVTLLSSNRLNAYILYENNENARNAVQNMQGYRLFGRPLRVRLSTRGDMYFVQRNANQVVPSSSTFVHSYETPPPSPDAISMSPRVNRCPLCNPWPTSISVQMNNPQHLNEAGPSSAQNTPPAEPPIDAIALPPRYANVVPRTLSDESDICLYVSNVPGNDRNATHYVAVALFQGCVGFQCVYVVPLIRGTVIASFWSSAQARLAMSVYDGYKVDNNLRLQIRIALIGIIQHINEPDFNPQYFFI